MWSIKRSLQKRIFPIHSHTSITHYLHYMSVIDNRKGLTRGAFSSKMSRFGNTRASRLRRVDVKTSFHNDHALKFIATRNCVILICVVFNSFAWIFDFRNDCKIIIVEFTFHALNLRSLILFLICL